jgi:hypothetical protein
MSRLSPIGLLALFWASSASAQAPIITPNGDPSVASDSLYKLAVKPADFPQEAVIWILDDGVVKVEADGRSSRTYRKVIQVLKQAAVKPLSEQVISYSPGHERMTLNWMRVLSPNGEVISDKPSQIQDSDIPAKMGNPVYSDRKVKRVSLTGLAPGNILDYSVTTEELKPFRPGDFLSSWIMNPGIRIMRSRYIVDLPNDKFRIKEQNLSSPGVIRTVGPRKTYMWTASNVPLMRREPYAADSNGVVAKIEIASPATWGDIAKWYADNARNRYVITPTVASKIAEMIRDSRSRDDSIRAIHRWVAQDIRYVAIALGLGGYQPRTPEEVVSTGFGDCKDKATLFVAALGTIGVTAYPVLLHSRANAKRDMPSILQFDHAIAAIGKDGRYDFVDLTASLIPFGQLPYDEQGGFALLVHPDGQHEELTLPVEPAESNYLTSRVRGLLTDNGLLNGTYEEEVGGFPQSILRSMFEHPLDSATRVNIPKRVLARYFQQGNADNLQAFDGKDLRAKPRMTFQFRNAKATEPAGEAQIFLIPLPTGSRYGALGADLEREGKRRFPIDARMVMGPMTRTSSFEITLPAEWTAKLPPSLTASSDFGTYSSEYTQNGRVLKIVRITKGTRGIFPPERMPDLIAWFKQIAKDDAKLIMIDKPAKAGN